MLFYLLSADELRALLRRLGYRLTRDTIRKTIEYYLARTSHGSTLSALVHAWVLGRANRGNALEHLTRLLRSDIAVIQGGTTAEGVHLAAMAGSVDVLQRCFTGLETTGDTLRFTPPGPSSSARWRLPCATASTPSRCGSTAQVCASAPSPGKRRRSASNAGDRRECSARRLGRVRRATQGRGALKSAQRVNESGLSDEAPCAANLSAGMSRMNVCPAYLLECS